MLPKKNRVDRKEAEKIFKNGLFLDSPNLSFRFLLIGGSKEPKISFVVPKAIAKLAVTRNRLRRIGYYALHKHMLTVPRGVIGMFFFKKKEEDLNILENEIKNIISKIN